MLENAGNRVLKWCVCFQVECEFRSVVPSACRLRDEWPKIRDQVLATASSWKTRNADLAKLLDTVNNDDEGCSFCTVLCTVVHKLHKIDTG